MRAESPNCSFGAYHLRLLTHPPLQTVVISCISITNGYGRNAIASYDMHRQQNSSDGERNLIGRRSESDRTANGIWSDGGRNPIGRRTESDRTANGIWSDGGRNLIGRRSVHDDNPWAFTPNNQAIYTPHKQAIHTKKPSNLYSIYTFVRYL